MMRTDRPIHHQKSIDFTHNFCPPNLISWPLIRRMEMRNYLIFRGPTRLQLDRVVINWPFSLNHWTSLCLTHGCSTSQVFSQKENCAWTLGILCSDNGWRSLHGPLPKFVRPALRKFWWDSGCLPSPFSNLPATASFLTCFFSSIPQIKLRISRIW